MYQKRRLQNKATTKDRKAIDAKLCKEKYAGIKTTDIERHHEMEVTARRQNAVKMVRLSISELIAFLPPANCFTLVTRIFSNRDEKTE